MSTREHPTENKRLKASEHKCTEDEMMNPMRKPV